MQNFDKEIKISEILKSHINRDCYKSKVMIRLCIVRIENGAADLYPEPMDTMHSII
jgi:hypothetical protein